MKMKKYVWYFDVLRLKNIQFLILQAIYQKLNLRPKPKSMSWKHQKISKKLRSTDMICKGESEVEQHLVFVRFEICS